MLSWDTNKNEEINMETKQDVFNQMLAYLPVGHEYDPVSDDFAGDLVTKYMERYKEAIPDDLPVIPEEVSDGIKQTYGIQTLVDFLEHYEELGFPNDACGFIVDNPEVVAEAWSRGLWIVEETCKVESYD